MFPLIESTFDIFKIIIVLLVGIPIALAIGSTFGLNKNRCILIFSWHTFFAFVYTVYVSVYGGDMRMYYISGVIGYDTFALGTDAIRFLSTLFQSISGLSFLGMGILFSYFGLIGLPRLRCYNKEDYC